MCFSMSCELWQFLKRDKNKSKYIYNRSKSNTVKTNRTTQQVIMLYLWCSLYTLVTVLFIYIGNYKCFLSNIMHLDNRVKHAMTSQQLLKLSISDWPMFGLNRNVWQQLFQLQQRLFNRTQSIIYKEKEPFILFTLRAVFFRRMFNLRTTVSCQEISIRLRGWRMMVIITDKIEKIPTTRITARRYTLQMMVNKCRAVKQRDICPHNLPEVT